MGDGKEAIEGEKTMTGCSGGFRALYNTVFGRRSSSSPRKSSSATATPRASFFPTVNSKRRRGGSDQSSLIVPHVNLDSPVSPGKSKMAVQQKVVQRQLDLPVRPPPPPVRPVAAPPVPTISGELESVIYDHQRSKASGNLVRASSSNVMLFGNLGNLRCGNSAGPASRNVLDYLPMTASEKESKGKTRNAGSGGGAPPSAAAGKTHNPKETAAPPAPTTCRVLSKRLDPETLKDLGDAQYENGRFAEALALYEQAAMVNPERSLYWVNKAAALAGLGRFLEAAADCREAVRIEPSNTKAHLRLAALYLR